MNMAIAPLDALKAENEFLREQVADLRRVLVSSDTPLPLEWKLSPSERRLFLCLVARERASTDALMRALYAGSAKDEPDSGIIPVFIHRMRRKLGPLGIEISSIYGNGYSLNSEVRARFAKRAKAEGTAS